MTESHCIELPGEEDTVSLGGRLISALLALSAPNLVLFLYGNLGAGKTTLSRGILRGLGYNGAVKSPTYTIVEPYELEEVCVYHFDLYRLGDPEELEFMGIRDYLESGSEQRPTLCLFEWPERGQGVLAAPDISVKLVERKFVKTPSAPVREDRNKNVSELKEQNEQGQAREWTVGRVAELIPETSLGVRIVELLLSSLK